MSFIYLASPYTSQDPDLSGTEKLLVMRERFEETMKLTSIILRSGIAVFSPIVHGHELAMTHDMPKSFDFWMNIDFAMISVCRQVWVHNLEGWDISEGVTAERKFALSAGKPVFLASISENIEGHYTLVSI